MLPRPLRSECFAVCALTLLALVLRVWRLDAEAVEHFDEGVYSSVLWYDGLAGEPYPARNFYAPPLLPALIEFASWLPGVGEKAPFLPAALFGTLTVPLVWLVARSWFGMAAGVFLAAVVALSDFHITYSRMALTDVPALFWIILSVWLHSKAVAQDNARLAILSGIACGLAWWTKYTGWLPLAINISGTALWWIWTGRRQVTAFRILRLVLIECLAVAAVFGPWWWELQSSGGYAGISANHARYLQPWSAWPSTLARQLTWQLQHDGLAAVCSLGIGLLAAGALRWSAAGSRTIRGSTENAPALNGLPFPPWSVLARFVAAAVAITVLAVRISSSLILMCLMLGGLAGMKLWPVLRRAWVAGDAAPRACPPDVQPQSWFGNADRRTTASVDPALGLCLTAVWFAGLLIATPRYAPYGRLMFPMLTGIWLAAAGGISWWVESNLSVARRQLLSPGASDKERWGRQLVAAMLTSAMLTAFVVIEAPGQWRLLQWSDLPASSVFRDRTSLARAADRIADEIVADVASQAAAPPASTLPATDSQRQATRAVIYVYGEPALLFHLNRTGLTALPVSHLNLRGTASDNGSASPSGVPVYVIFGPHAKRSDGFWEELFQQSVWMDLIAEVRWQPGFVSMQDLFNPGWLALHPEAHEQVLELHRVR